MRCLGSLLALLLALCAIASAEAQAQITEIIDATGDGAGNGLDEGWGIAVDASGNVYVTGAMSDNAFEITSPPKVPALRPPVLLAFALLLLAAGILSQRGRLRFSSAAEGPRELPLGGVLASPGRGDDVATLEQLPVPGFAE